MTHVWLLRFSEDKRKRHRYCSFQLLSEVPIPRVLVPLLRHVVRVCLFSCGTEVWCRRYAAILPWHVADRCSHRGLLSALLERWRNPWAHGSDIWTVWFCDLNGQLWSGRGSQINGIIVTGRSSRPFTASGCVSVTLLCSDTHHWHCVAKLSHDDQYWIFGFIYLDLFFSIKPCTPDAGCQIIRHSAGMSRFLTHTMSFFFVDPLV